jgi:hypothetical protein
MMAAAADAMLIDPPPPPQPALMSPQRAGRRAHRLARLPERLVFVVDIAAEMGQGWTGPGDETTRFGVVRLLLDVSC